MYGHSIRRGIPGSIDVPVYFYFRYLCHDWTEKNPGCYETFDPGINRIIFIDTFGSFYNGYYPPADNPG